MKHDGLYRRDGSRFWWFRDPLTGRRTSTGLEDYSAAKACRAERLELLPPKVKAPRKSALADGRLTRGPCEVCGDPKSNGHHDDYAKPLVVRWLCSRHHRLWHAEHGEAPNAYLTEVAVMMRGGLRFLTVDAAAFRAKAHAWLTRDVTSNWGAS